MVKVVKNLFLIIFVISLFGYSLFANASSFIIKSNKQTFDINEKIRVEVSLETNENLLINKVQIEGIDNFEVISSSNSHSIQIINNVYSLNYKLVYELLANKTGKYVLGPAKISVGTGEMISNMIELNIEGEKVFSHGIPGGLGTNNKNNIENVGEGDFVDGNADYNNEIFQANYLFYGTVFFIILILIIVVYFLFNSVENSINKKIVKNNDHLDQQNNFVFDYNNPNFEESIYLFFKSQLNNKFGLNADSLTNDEIFTSLVSNELFPKNKINALKNFLEALNLLKYSNLLSDKEKIIIYLNELFDLNK